MAKTVSVFMVVNSLRFVLAVLTNVENLAQLQYPLTYVVLSIQFGTTISESESELFHFPTSPNQKDPLMFYKIQKSTRTSQARSTSSACFL